MSMSSEVHFSYFLEMAGRKFKNSAVIETVKVLSSRGKNTLDCALICSN